MSGGTSNVNLVRASALEGLDGLVEELGGNLESSLSKFGLKVADLADPDRFIPYSNVVLAIETMAAEFRVQDFGLRLSARQNLEYHGLLWLIMQSAPTVRDGVLAGIKYVSFHSPAQGYRYFRSEDGALECVEMYQRVPDLPSMPQIAEHAVGQVFKIVVELSGGSLRPAEVHFRHARIGRDDKYVGYFGVTPMFESSFDGIAVSPSGFRKPIANQSPLLRQFMERFMVGVTDTQRQTTTQQVSALLQNLVRANVADLATVATIMGQHPRTLQRRLDADGKGFEALRDAARRDWARQLLSQPELSLAHIGDMLGFSDQSVLTRACQRWFGATPKRLRQNPDMMDAKAAD